MSLAGDPFQNPHEGFTAIQEKADSLFHRTVDLFSRAERTEHNGYDFSVRSTSSGASAKDRAYGPTDEFVETPKADFGRTPTLSGRRDHLVSPTYVARDGPRDEREVQEKRAWWGGMEDRDPRDGDLDSPRLTSSRAETPTKRRGWSWFGRSASTEVADDGKHQGSVQRRRGWFNWSRAEQDEAEAAAKVRDLEQDPKRKEEERHFLQRREDDLAREEAEVRRLRAASSSSARSAASPSSSTSQSHRDASAPGGIFAHRAEERAAAVRRAEDIARDARANESAHEIRHHTGVAEHRDALDAVGDAATSAANSTRGAVAGAKDAVVNTASHVAHDVKDVVVGAKDAVVGAKDAVVNTTSGVAHSVADGVSSAAHGVTNVASGVVHGVGQAASGLAHGVTNVASNVVEGTKDVVTGAAEKVSDIAHSAKDVVERVFTGGEGGPENRYAWDSRDGLRGERGERLQDSFDRTKEHVRGYTGTGTNADAKHSDFLSHLGHTGQADLSAGGTGGGGKLDEMAARAESTQRDVRRTAQEMASSVGKPELARHAENVTAEVKRTARETAAAMEDATENLKDKAAKAKFVATHVAGDVKDRAGHIADDVKGKVVDAKDKVADAASDAKDRVKGAAIDVKDKVKDVAGDMKDRVASKTDDIKRDVRDAKRDIESRAASTAAPLSPSVEREMRANAKSAGDAKELDMKTESKTSSGPASEVKKALVGTSEVRRNVGTPSRNEPSDTTPSRESTADTRRDMRKDVRDMAWVSRDREGVQWDAVGEHPHHGHHAGGDVTRGYENAKLAVSGSTTPSADPSRTPQRAPSPAKESYDRDRSWAAATESADLSRTRRMDGTVDRSTLMVLKREEERLHQLADKAHEEADRKHKEADRALEATIPHRFPARGEPRGLFAIDEGKRRDEENSAPLLTDERFAHMRPGEQWDRTHLAPGLPGDRTAVPSDMQREQDYMFRAEDRKYAADADLSGGNQPPSERRGVWDRLKDAATNVRASVQP